MDVVVIGGGSAGMAAACAADESGADTVLLERGREVGVRTDLLPYLLSGEVTESDLHRSDLRSRLEKGGVELRLSEGVTGMDPGARFVRSVRGSYKSDSVVIATGSVPKPEERLLPGSVKRNFFRMTGKDDYLLLAKDLRDLTRVAVLGPSPVSLLTADLISRSGRSVVLFLPGGSSLGWVPSSIGEALCRRATESGVQVIPDGISAVAGVDKVEAVVSTGGRVHPCDAVVIFPHRAASLPVSGIRLGSLGGALVDDHMRTSVASVFAAGDCAELRRGNSSVAVKLWSTSKTSGEVAGVNAARGDAIARVSGVILQRLFGVDVCAAGMDKAQATAVGLDPAEFTLELPEAVEVLSSQGGVCCTMVVDKRSLTVCGLAMIGPTASTYSPAISLVVSMGLRVSDLAFCETPHSPGISTGSSAIVLTAKMAVAAFGARA